MDYNYPNDMYYQEQTDVPYPFVQESHMLGTSEYASTMPHIVTPDIETISAPLQTQVPRTQAKRQSRSKQLVRGPARPKTPWSLEQNQQFFRVMAEYIYVDKTGIWPLAIYLNPAELDHVEQCEMSLKMTDTEIAQSLCEQEVESNPNRCSHKLFGVLRHMQLASGNHGVRVVNEKAKNVRSRIIRSFMTMYANGSLPTKRPVRYVAAILSSLAASPFCPAKEGSMSMPMSIYATNDNKHDVGLWLQAMFWLYPRRMYEFLVQCSVQIIRTWVEGVSADRRTREDFHMLTVEEPDIFVIVEQLRRMVGFLGDDTGKKPKNTGSRRQGSSDAYNQYGNGGDNDDANKKRKRKLTLQESKKRIRGASDMVVTNDGEQMSLSLFELLKNEEKLQIAGKRIKMLAAVGGVVRNGSAGTSLDVKYHMYRLWTCVARLAEINQMLVPNNMIPHDEALGWPRFAEFIVVTDYNSPFDAASVEPRLRVSKTRLMCNSMHHNVEEMIEQWVASTEGETRREIPLWLVAARRIDGKYVLGLVISSLNTETPVLSDQNLSLVTSFRKFSDDELAPALKTAIATGGNVELGNATMCSCSGLDPWPWGTAQPNTDEHNAPIKIDVDGSDIQLMVSSAYPNSSDVINPWMEPRVMPNSVFDRQQQYADMGIIKDAPTFDELMSEEGNRSGVAAIRVKPATPTTSNTWQQMPAMPLSTNHFSALGGQMSAFTPHGFAGLDNVTNVAGAAGLSVYQGSDGTYTPDMYSNMYQQPTQPMFDPSGALLIDPSHHLPVDMLNGYDNNGWSQNGLDPNSPYPQIFGNSGAPSEYGPP
ncbi:hypothetical protein GGH12_002035 [Coemansia sp. RSA 1822]|nr:hypothetical protein LPJ76_002445 [Coemansia sp. RSA 638]KAJ2564385.1 hypothetical protein GGH12_002035 [Coemansia sp. RSA 1822]